MKELSDNVAATAPSQPVKTRCSRLARFFDDYLARHTVKPDNTGAVTFPMLKSVVAKYAGELPSIYFRNILKNFGYILSYKGKWVSVTKQYT